MPMRMMMMVVISTTPLMPQEYPSTPLTAASTAAAAQGSRQPLTPRLQTAFADLTSSSTTRKMRRSSSCQSFTDSASKVRALQC